MFYAKCKTSLRFAAASSVAMIFAPPPPANKLFGSLAKGLRRLLLPGGPLVDPFSPALPAVAGSAGPSLRHWQRHERLLHWLPVQRRISYKIAILARDFIHGIGPTYFGDVCAPVTANSCTDGVELTSIFAQTFCYKPRTFPKRTENIHV